MNPPRSVTDATGRRWTFPEAPRRVVSLVPSLTHTLAGMGHAGTLAGRTRYCDQPAAALATVPVVGGTKDPDLEQIVALEPDLVLMDTEENRAADAEKLRATGLRVWAVLPVTVDDVVAILRDLAGVFQSEAAACARIDRLAANLAAARRDAPAPVPVFCAVWRGPYMSFNGRTYISSILEAAGLRNVLADHPDRYFRVDPASLRLPPDTRVLLPTEPFRFDQAPLAEIAAELGVPAERILVVHGELLTWYGLMTDEALGALRMLRDHLAPCDGSQIHHKGTKNTKE